MPLVVAGDTNSLPIQVHTNKEYHFRINFHERSLIFYMMHHFIIQCLKNMLLYSIEIVIYQYLQLILQCYFNGHAVAVADPGFPVGGMDLRRGTWTPDVATFQKICMSKWKNLDPWGDMCRARPSLDPPMSGTPGGDRYFPDNRFLASCHLLGTSSPNYLGSLTVADPEFSVGERQLPPQLCFVKFVCENKRIDIRWLHPLNLPPGSANGKAPFWTGTRAAALLSRQFWSVKKSLFIHWTSMFLVHWSRHV